MRRLRLHRQKLPQMTPNDLPDDWGKHDHSMKPVNARLNKGRLWVTYQCEEYVVIKQRMWRCSEIAMILKSDVDLAWLT